MWKHDQQDADYFFKELGFDFIKIDFCGGMAYGNSMKKDMDCRERYTAIRRAVDAARPGVRINVCRWDYPGTWVREIGSSWRISGDINATWGRVKAIIEENLYLSAYAAPGAYNDMDMLEVGRGLTEEEDRTHFAVWCMMSSPLLIGCDLESLRENPKTLALLKNQDLIALDQDTAAPQAYVAQRLGDKPCEMSISAKEIDLAGINRARCITASSGACAEWFPLEDGRRISAGGAVPAHGTRVYLVETAKRLERELYESETAFLPTYQELSDPKKAKTAYYAKDDKASGGMYAAGLGGRKGNDIVWEKVWSKDGGTYQMLVKTVGEGGAVKAKANGAECARAKTPGGMEAFCAFRVALRPGINNIRLYNDEEPLPGIDAMWLTGDVEEGGAGDVR